MSGPILYTQMEKECVVYRYHPETDAKVVVLYDSMPSSANAFVKKKMGERTEKDISNGVYYRAVCVRKPIRSFWGIERIYNGERVEIIDEFVADQSDAYEMAGQLSLEEDKEEEDGRSPYSYDAIELEMEDEEILYHYFDGDEALFEKHMGCKPLTYDRLLTPGADDPQTLSLPLEGENR